MDKPTTDPVPPELRVAMDAEFQLANPVSATEQPAVQKALAEMDGVEAVNFIETGISIRYDPERVTKGDLAEMIGRNGLRVAETESAPATPPIEPTENAR